MKELDALYETIKDRKENKEEGSYTTYLFEKGLEKILKKVGEECTEVVIASLTQTKEDQINEIGDLLYHLTVLMVEKGISMEDVNAELERRAQKTHNLKSAFFLFHELFEAMVWCGDQDCRIADAKERMPKMMNGMEAVLLVYYVRGDLYEDKSGDDAKRTVLH